MRHLTDEEREILRKMDELDENSPEYKALQERLIEIDKIETGDTPFCH